MASRERTETVVDEGEREREREKSSGSFDLNRIVEIQPPSFRPVHIPETRRGRRDKLDLMTVAKKRDMKVERAGRTDRIKF